MTNFVVYEPATARIADIYDYSFRRWGPATADTYIDGLFEQFETIAGRRDDWRSTHSDYGWNGYFRRYRSHMIFWRENGDGRVGIVTVLHGRMDLPARLQDDIRFLEEDTP